MSRFVSSAVVYLYDMSKAYIRNEITPLCYVLRFSMSVWYIWNVRMSICLFELIEWYW
jgi:hypothetical protein